MLLFPDLGADFDIYYHNYSCTDHAEITGKITICVLIVHKL